VAEILIIDDDEMLCKTLSRYVNQFGHNASYALTLREGTEQASRRTFDLVFLDVQFPDGNGLEALPMIRNTASPPEVIIITGEGDPDGAEIAIRNDAWAYIEKPLSVEKIRLQLLRALQYRKEKAENSRCIALKRGGIVGSSPRLQECLDLVARISDSDTTVLLTGETGTGKELFARAIHHNSPRAKGGFVVVDCAAMPSTLVESMLFGHEKGAFTGAEKERPGLIREADGGTLFLDEIGELPPAIQKDFLRVLQEFRFRPLGSNREVRSDFRLVAATNQDLEEKVRAGMFRRDLFYRIHGFHIHLPPLRDRIPDIKDLALHYMVQICERYGIETKGFSPEFFDALSAYDWPGNVRELIKTLENVITINRNEPTLFPRHLPTHICVQHARSLIPRKTTEQEDTSKSDHKYPAFLPTLREIRRDALSRIESQYLDELLSITKGNIKEACRISGLSRSRLYDLIKKHGCGRP